MCERAQRVCVCDAAWREHAVAARFVAMATTSAVCGARGARGARARQEIGAELLVLQRLNSWDCNGGDADTSQADSDLVDCIAPVSEIA